MFKENKFKIAWTWEHTALLYRTAIKDGVRKTTRHCSSRVGDHQLEGNDFCHLIIIKIISLTLDPSLEAHTNYLGACRIHILEGVLGAGTSSKIPRIHVEFRRRQEKEIFIQLGKSTLNLEGRNHPALVRGVQGGHDIRGRTWGWRRETGSATGSHGMCGETYWDDRLFKCLERVGFLPHLMKTQ